MSSCKVYNVDSLCNGRQYKNCIVGVCLSICIVVTAMMAYFNYKERLGINSTIKKNDVVRYDNMIYKIVPNDLIKKNNELKEVLDKYSVGYEAKKESMGKYLISLSKENDLYTIKGVETKDLLILYDSNKECTYAFSEKLVSN